MPCLCLLFVTGPKVVSKAISESSIDELTEVIQRPPVIWDNLHANDYDQRRLFLGPYVGRSVELIPKLNGVLTNPNCEYGANYIPIHTLAQWSHSGRHIDRTSPPIKQSIMLEVEGSGGDGRGEQYLYEPQKALEISLVEWFKEFQIVCKKLEHYKPAKSAEFIAKAPEDNGGGGGGGSGGGGGCGSSSSSFPPVATETMHISNSLPAMALSADNTFSLDDVRLLIDYFYLPHKHGSRAMHILEEFCWLKETAPGYELLKAHGHLKGQSDDELEDSNSLPGSSVSSDGMRSDGETSESIADEMSGTDVSLHGYIYIG